MTECCCANTKVVSVDDYNAVLEAAHNYVEGLRTGDADTVAKAFHKEFIVHTAVLVQNFVDGQLGQLFAGGQTVLQLDLQLTWMCLPLLLRQR